MFSNQLSYFIIAFAIYLFGKSILFFSTTPPVHLVFEISMSISLLCSNIPRVIPISFRNLYYMHKLERMAFGIALLAFVFMLFK